MDGETLSIIVVFGCITIITLASLVVVNMRKAYEARQKGPLNNDEVNALRHEVAHLNEKVNQLMLQVEFNREHEPASLSERVTPPEFNKLG